MGSNTSRPVVPRKAVAERRPARNPVFVAWFLTGISPQRFVNQYYDRNPLHIYGRGADFYKELLGFDDFESLIAGNADELRKHLLISRDGADYFQRGQRPEALSLMLREAFAEGYTIALYKTEERWPPIARLVRACTEWLMCASSASAFLTPAGTKAFDRHFDIYDGFILQIDGEKDWRIFASEVDDQRPALQYRREHDATAVPLQTVTLRPGDLLYLPRGYPHE